jgi:hypothetical protein
MMMFYFKSELKKRKEKEGKRKNGKYLIFGGLLIRLKGKLKLFKKLAIQEEKIYESIFTNISKKM